MPVNIDLRLGDCLELMRDIPDKSIDLIVTDPPYMMTQAKCDSMRIDIPALSEQFKRLAKRGAAWVIFGQTKSIVDWIVANKQRFKYSIVWDKCAVFGHLDANRRPLRTYELINIFCDGRTAYNPQKTKGKPYIDKRRGSGFTEAYGHSFQVRTQNNLGLYYPKDILKFPARVEHDIKHPFKKPVALMEWLVKTYSNPGDTVLDPFMGSGTTGVACVNLNRNFIGMEIDEKYYQIAVKRIEDAQRDKLARLPLI